MKKSGCYSLVFGIESGDEDVLERINKKISLDMVEGALRMTKEAGIKTTGFFIIGLPTDTRDSILRTISVAKKLPLDRAQFGLFAPLPGSSDFDHWLEKEKPDSIDWDAFNLYNVIYKLDTVLKHKVKTLQKKAFKEFYLRPRIVLNILREIHPREFIPVFKRLKDIFGL
jgi:radical SAM superfamily enzyme YgiQ (UPF0313 family)